MTTLINGKEISQIAHESMELRMQGKVEEAREMLKLIPISPGVAYAIKRREGLDALLSRGYNLSEVEAKFGKEWLQH
ncbi:MAG: hypothetical protein LBM77_11355 [Spirochaetaceae bacterium]|jgi:hypothetical protein|nr:hypothetical protein [Spirochaetaceae bacterium]